MKKNSASIEIYWHTLAIPTQTLPFVLAGAVTSRKVFLWHRYMRKLKVIFTLDRSKEVPRFNSQWKHKRPAQETSATAIHESNTSAVSGFCWYASAYAIQLLYDNFAEKNMISRHLLTCCFPNNTLEIGCFSRLAVGNNSSSFYTSGLQHGISFVLPGPPPKICHPQPFGISQLIVRTELIFRPLLGPWSGQEGCKSTAPLMFR